MKLPYSFYIALRYLKSKKQKGISFQTFVSIGGVAVGVMSLLVVISVMTGFQQDIQKKILGVSAHAVVLSADGTIPNYENLISTLKKENHVISASPFVLGQIMVSYDKEAQGVYIRGINPSEEKTVTDIQAHMKEGSLDALKNPPDGKPGIILGYELASRLGAFKGDTVRVISPTGELGPLGMLPRVREFKVVGVFEVGMFEYDSNLVLTDLKSAQDFFGLGNRVNGLQLKLDDIYKAPEVRSAISSKLGMPYYVKDWIQMNRNLFAALKLEKITMFVILTLIIIVAAFNIVSTLMMNVIEKQREIAILKAMGASKRGIMGVFMIQGFMIGVIGTIIGMAGGFVLGYLLNTYHLIKLPADVYYLSHLPAKMSVQDFVLVSISALLISFSATIYPAWQAARLDPVESLRYE